MLQIIVHWVVVLDIVGVHVTADILVPTADTLLEGPHGNGVARLLCQILEREAYTRPHTILGHATHHVLPQLIVSIKEEVDLHRQQGLRRDGLRALDALPLHVFPDMFLPIGILEHLHYQFALVPEVRLHHCLTLGNGHRYTRLQTILCQPRQCGMTALFPVGDAFRIVVCLGEIELEYGVHTSIEIPV